MIANFVSRRLIRWAAVAMLMTASPIVMLSERPVYAQTAPVVVIEVQGAITALNGTTIVVNGLTIDISTAQVRGTLAVGKFVKVEGTLLADGSVKARQVKVVAAAALRQEMELTGVVGSITGDVMVIAGQSFNVATAEIGRGVAVGARVNVHFTLVDGVFVAREVSVAPAARPGVTATPRAGSDDGAGHDAGDDHGGSSGSGSGSGSDDGAGHDAGDDHGGGSGSGSGSGSGHGGSDDGSGHH